MSKQTVAILGASADRKKYGNKAVRAFVEQGYEVYPVNPKGGEIEGLTVYKTLDEVPVAPLFRISMYLPPEIGITMLKAIAAKGCEEFLLNPGSESDELVAAAEQLGLNPMITCSILRVGSSPGDFPD